MYDHGDRMSITLNEYQNKARSTALYPEAEALSYTVLGLNGEAGELAEKMKKCLRDDAGILTENRKAAMQKELGDVLWYVANLAYELDATLEQIAEGNLEKLFSRKRRGTLQGSGDER